MSFRDDRINARRAFTQEHPGASLRLAMAFGRDTVLERKVTQGSAGDTGLPSLDLLLGALPWGVVELSGEHSVGKTGTLYQVIARAQNDQRPVGLLATEIIDVPYMTRAGIDTRNMPVFLGASALSDFVEFVGAHEGVVAGIDSSTALRPEEQDPVAWNQMMWDLLKAITDVLRPGSCVIVLSQMRRGRTKQSKHSASFRFLDFFQTKLELLRKDVTDKGYTMVVNVKAHPLALPARYTELPSTKGSGVDIPRDLLRVATILGILEKKGSWYRLGDEGKLGPGEDGARAWLLEHPEDLHALHFAVYELLHQRAKK